MNADLSQDAGRPRTAPRGPPARAARERRVSGALISVEPASATQKVDKDVTVNPVPHDALRVTGDMPSTP
jgi:hypothetical protein